MPRQKTGGRDGGQRAAWATGNYNQGEEESGSSGDDGPSERPAQQAMTVKLAMWDLGQCDRKRSVLLYHDVF